MTSEGQQVTWTDEDGVEQTRFVSAIDLRKFNQRVKQEAERRDAMALIDIRKLRLFPALKVSKK